MSKKVFKVITERLEGKEIIEEIQYVTSESDTLQSVVNYFAAHCEQYPKELKGVHEVVTIVQHINR